MPIGEYGLSDYPWKYLSFGNEACKIINRLHNNLHTHYLSMRQRVEIVR